MILKDTEYEALSVAIRKKSLITVKKILNQHNGLIIDDQWLDYILLIQAIQRGCKRIAQLLLDSGCRVNKEDATCFFHTPLYYAVRLGDVKLVEILLNRGAIINGRDRNLDSPFCLALKKRNYKIVDKMLAKYLLRNNKTSFSEDDYIAFNAACLRNNSYVVEDFIKRGIDLNKYQNVDAQDETYCTSLHIAVKHHNPKVIKLLLKYGANVNAKNGLGQTPLHLAYYMKEQNYPLKDCWKVIDAIVSGLKRTSQNPVDDCGLSHFHIACTTDQIEIVNHFLILKEDINSTVNFDSPMNSGYTPLHFAIESRHRQVVNLLLSNGADTTIQNRDGNTPFHFAFSYFYSDNEFTDFMLSKYVPKNVNPVNNIGLSHFHIACSTKSTSSIESFLQNGASINAAVNLDLPKCPGYTPLHFAVEFNRKGAVEILLQHNADLKAVEKEGFTPLHLACQQNAKKIHSILRNSVNVSNSYEKVNFESSFKQSPKKVLDSIAQQNDQVDIVKLLLLHKSDVNAQDNLGKTPLFYACDIDYGTFECEFGRHMTQTLHCILNEFYHKRHEIIKTLLWHQPNINIIDKTGKTVLHYIAESNKIYSDEKKADIATMLLNVGADINAQTYTGLTPLHIALIKGFWDLIEVFLKYDVDPNIAENENLYTSLHLATGNDLLAPKNEEIIRTLLQKGANIDLKQRDGKTALHLAASTRYSTNRIVPLLEIDCNIDSQDAKGRTPLHMACINRTADNVKNLLNHGADINITDRYCRTALYYYYEFQIEILDSQRLPMFDFHQIYYTFMYHIRRLRTIGFFVSWDNMSYYMKLKDRHTEYVINNSGNDILGKCEDEIKKMKSIQINNYATLYDILFKDPNEMTLYVKNEELLNILKSYSFENDFAQYGFLLKLQYRRGLSRSNLLKPAKDALELILSFSLPDSCSETIFRYLNDDALKTLIEASTTINKNTNEEVEK